MTKPFNNRPEEPELRRRLREVPFQQRVAEGRAVDEEDITEADLRDLFDGFAYQTNRATALLREIEPKLAKMSIPILPDAIDVKNAVRRRMKIRHDPTEIPFDLYKNMFDDIAKKHGLATRKRYRQALESLAVTAHGFRIDDAHRIASLSPDHVQCFRAEVTIAHGVGDLSLREA